MIASCVWGARPAILRRLRLAAWANGWALPEGKPVWTVSSGAALAAEIFAERPEIAQVAAWGDARRGTIWAGL